jgi:long-chain acyl-CoA synthetase
MPPRSNLPALFLSAVREKGRPDLFGARRSGGWEWISSQDALAQVREIAAGLVALGLQAGERVALVSENRPEWIMSDLGIQFAGGITVPVYPTLPAEQVRYLLRDSGARIAIVSTTDQASKINSVRRDSAIEHVAGMDTEAEGVLHFSALRERGAAHLLAHPGLIEERLAGLSPGNLATIIYTSGTTGIPKGVMLTHANIASNVDASIRTFQFEQGDLALSFLPLSHVLERMVQYAFLEMGIGIAYVRSLERVADSLVEVRPNVFVTVPRLLERVAQKVTEGVEQQTGLKKFIGGRALAAVDAAADAFLAGHRPRGVAALSYGLAERLIAGKVREKLGGRVRFLISGGAALSPSVARFFWGLGIPVYEGYGLTETAPVLAVNFPGAVRVGSVGKPIPGVEIRIAGDGEILSRGPNVMTGYLNKPLETEEVLRGGWFHTGDLGAFDKDGFLKITGRKKEIMVLSTGKNIAPRAIEEALERSPYIAQVVAVGDERPSVGALIVPNFDAVVAWAREKNLPVDDRGALLARPEVRQLFQQEINRHQANLAVFEKARQFEFLHEEPSEENGLLTPTKKIRRRAIIDRFRHLVERMYQ